MKERKGISVGQLYTSDIYTQGRNSWVSPKAVSFLGNSTILVDNGADTRFTVNKDCAQVYVNAFSVTIMV